MISAGKHYLMTSESVTEGHPDKVCDQISDTMLDELLRQDPMSRVACETFITTGLLIVGGEITTTGYLDVQKLARGKLRDIGYTAKFGFDADSCGILNSIGQQSPDISQGVDTGGAGDQGIMIGYACKETPELMPIPIMLAHRLSKRLADVRKKGTLGYLGPDGKSQVSVEYANGVPNRIDSVVISSQHTEEILDETGHQITQESRDEIRETIINAVIDPEMLDDKTKYFINPTGKFVVGGPKSDVGLTGRKIIVDTYGGLVPHGGGAFSGKDPTKVDRSGAYAARYVAKNVVAAGLAEKCAVAIAYIIGVAEPASVTINTYGTGKISNEDISARVRKHFDLTPKGIIEGLDLRKPRYAKTAAYGHFGREDKEFTWEQTDMADDLSL